MGTDASTDSSTEDSTFTPLGVVEEPVQRDRAQIKVDERNSNIGNRRPRRTPKSRHKGRVLTLKELVGKHQRRHEDELKSGVQDSLQSPLERLQSLEGDVTRMQQELYEVQERLVRPLEVLEREQGRPIDRRGG